MEARDQIRSNDILSKIPLLNGLKQGEKSALIQNMGMRQVSAGNFVFHKGDKFDYLSRRIYLRSPLFSSNALYIPQHSSLECSCLPRVLSVFLYFSLDRYIITHGRAEVVIGSGVVVATLGPGQYFGEIGLLSAGVAGNTSRRTASIRASIDLTLGTLDRDALNAYAGDYLMSKLAEASLSRLDKDSTRELGSLTGTSSSHPHNI